MLHLILENRKEERHEFLSAGKENASKIIYNKLKERQDINN